MSEFKPKYWTKELVAKEALKYKCRSDFRVNMSGAYKAAKRFGIFDEVCKHMPVDAKIGNPSSTYFWTPSKIVKEAKKYTSKGIFAKANGSAYHAAKRHGILEEVCSHMPKHVDQSGDKNSRFRWTIKKLKKEALKYKTVGDFQKYSKGAYLSAFRQNLLPEITKDMTRSIKESKAEVFLFNEIKKRYPKTQKFVVRKKDLIPDKPYIHGFDIDIYVPELRKGIEFDGNYFHSIEGLRRSRPHWPEEGLADYHDIKDGYFASKGIKILHIREKDWLKDSQSCIDKCLEFLS